MIKFENYFEPEYNINSKKEVIIGKTGVMINLFHYINHLANLPTTVLLSGKTGTGKELFAKALHYNSQRKNNNFVAVNCAGIPSELLESELFGYVKGSFTGAYNDTKGKFQYADKGTILLDEIADMSLKLQSKVLRVLQEKQITRVGSNTPEEIDVRVIAATNKNLEEEINSGNFREDLYYRLNVVPVKVPELNERKEDIPLIAEHFIKKYNEIYGFQIDGISESAKERLKQVEWKGNVRELENIIERVFVLKKRVMIEADDLYFNSDMPKKFLIKYQDQIIFKEEPNEKSGNSSDMKKIETQKLWYQQGVIPISPKSISQLDGSREYTNILKLIEKEKVYSVRLGSGKQRTYSLVYLAPDSVQLFFRDTTTRDYNNLETRIKEDSFNEIVKEPFAFFLASDLIENTESFRNYISIKKAVEKSKAYKVPVGKNFCFAITLSNLGYFIKKEQSEEKNTEKNKELDLIIRQKYEKFKNFNP